MSIDHVSRVLALPPAVNGTTRMVLFVLAEAANTDTNECWPHVETIARRAGIQQAKYVAKAIAALEELGLVEVEPNGCPDSRVRGDRRPNLYRMVGDMAVIDGGARRASGGARRASTGGRVAPDVPLSKEPEQEPEQEPGASVVVRDRFDEFYDEAYPRKEARRTARRAWDGAIKRADPEAIIVAARRFASDPNREQAYTPHPATWLNADRWLDDPLPARSSGKPSRIDEKLAALEQSRQPRPGRPDPRAIGAGS